MDIKFNLSNSYATFLGMCMDYFSKSLGFTYHYIEYVDHMKKNNLFGKRCFPFSVFMKL